MTKAEIERAKKIHNLGYMTYESRLVDEVNYALAGYENVCADNRYTLEQAKENFYPNLKAAVEAIHKIFRKDLFERRFFTNQRFKTNKKLDEDIESIIRIEFGYLLLPDDTFDFTKCWYYVDTPTTTGKTRVQKLNELVQAILNFDDKEIDRLIKELGLDLQATSSEYDGLSIG